MHGRDGHATGRCDCPVGASERRDAAEDFGYNQGMSDGIASHDGRRRRCPRLGHEVPFGYCRRPARDLPCGRIADCWWEQFDVAGFLRAHYAPEQIGRILAPPAPKAATLVDLIRQVRRRRGGG